MSRKERITVADGKQIKANGIGDISNRRRRRKPDEHQADSSPSRSDAGREFSSSKQE